MEAITTRYKGYRFRSRTEARWAVFFDALGIAWEYEEQGYVLDDGKDGIPYLPDFRLPDHKMFVEIKGANPSKREIKKATLLAMHSGDPVLMLAGVPIDPQYAREGSGEHIKVHPNGLRDVVTVAEIFKLSKGAPELLSAYGQAMGARFEHGERPNARILNR